MGPRLSGRGLLEPSQAVQIQGFIRASSHEAFATGRGIGSSVFYDHVNLTGWVRETKWQTVGNGKDGKGLATDPSHERKRLEDLQFARIEVRTPDVHAEWALRSMLPSARLVSAPSTRCSAYPADADVFGFHGVQDPPRNLAPWDPIPRAFNLTCASGSLTVDGSHGLLLYNTRVDVAYVSSEDDSPHKLTIQTGTIVTPNATLPGVYDHVRRLAEFQPLGPGTMAINASGPFRLQVPALTAGGHLILPRSSGRLAWGDWNTTNPEVLELQGLFELAAPQPSGMAIKGATVNPPPGHSSPEIPTAPPNPIAAAMLVTGTIATLTWLGLRAKWLLLSLFTRMTEGKALRHDRRRALLAFLEHNSGSSIQRASQGLEIPRRAVRYHADVLSRQGLVLVRRVGRETVLFLRGSSPGDAPSPPLEPPVVQRLLAELERDPSISQNALAQRLRVTRSYVSRLLRQLVSKNRLIVEGRRGRRSYVVSGHAKP